MRIGRIASFFLSVSLLIALPTAAGTISVAWDPVSDPDLAGYRLYWGNSVGNYTQQQDVGIGTSATLSGLTDCATYYVGVKARDALGNVSASYSNEISGYPRPVVTAVSPASAEQGLQLNVMLTGANFMSGATVQLGNAGIAVNSVTVNSCNQITASITVGSGAAAGATTLDVTNPDQVFGTSSGLFTVLAATPPTVASTSPASGATGVPLNAQPAVTFSEAVRATTVTSATVQLLAGSTPVAQAVGSPSLSADGRTATIVPAANLTYNTTYRIQVLGGTSGVRDLANNALASTFTQTPGFTTVTDASAPSISAVSATAQATTAAITWTTTEPADSQVFYRRGSETTYQQTAVDTTLGTSHSVQIQGLTPATQYSFHVRSADGAGNAATSSPDGTFTTATNSYAYIAIEAESGTLTTPMRATAGTGAFRGAWIDTASGTPAGTSSAPAGRSDLGFYAPVADTWYLWVRLYGAAAASDAWYESIDGATRQSIAPSATGAWFWTAGRSYTLTQGLHNLELGGREAQARADRVLITNDPTFVPTEAPGADVTPPSSPSGLSGTAGTGQVTLNWTNPASDTATVVARYRSDGRYPTSPSDGLPGIARAATPGTSDSATQTGLQNGTTYWFSVFAVDAAGNASSPAQVQGTPSDITPPGDVGNLRRTDRR